MIKGLNAVIDMIESHLKKTLTLEMLVEVSGMPEIQLKKVFFFLSQMSLSEYIKCRRLTSATQDLLNGVSITEVAYTYCYESLDGFTRAYKAWSGILPSEVRRHHIITTTPKLSFKIQVEGGTTMQVKLVQLPAFKFAGVSKRVSLQFEGVNTEIVALAQSITQKQRTEMHQVKTMDPKQILNISWDSDTNFTQESGSLIHMIGVMTSYDTHCETLEEKDVSSHTWAVFTCDGPFPEKMQNLHADIYAKWLPSSNYELVDAPTFSYTIDSNLNPSYKFSEIYIPVKELQL